MRKPEFVTFTGADDNTPTDHMIALSMAYPIEWGLLFSESKQGKDPRYPSLQAMANIAEKSILHRGGQHGLRLSGHLCGAHSRNVMLGLWPWIEVSYGVFQRFQVNSRDPDVRAIAAFSARVGNRRCIAQCRDANSFPEDESISWLFDQSGGRGAEPGSWPAHPAAGRLVGYAGGIGPDNALNVIEAINSDGPYWIDMESKVRTNDRFDLELCLKVCEQIWGVR